MSNKSSAVHWTTADWTPESPFGGTLTWTSGDDTYAAPLEPILVLNLFTALATILEAQRLSLLPGRDPSAIILPSDLSKDAQWSIADWTPENPFTGSLVWSDTDGTEVLRSDLNPILVRDLSTELASIHLAQREALGLPSDLDNARPSVPSSISEDERDEAVDLDGGDYEDAEYEDYLEEDLLDEQDLDEDEETIDIRRWWVRHPVKAFFAAVPLFWIVYAIIAGALAV